MNLRPLLLTTLYLIFVPTLLFAQKKELAAANAAYKIGDYYTAAHNYRAALTSSQLKLDGAKLAEAQHKYAEASRKTFNYDRAEEYYGKVSVSKYADKYPAVDYYYAIALKRNGKYKAAITIFKKFQAIQTKDKEVLRLQGEASHEQKGCLVAQQLIANPDKKIKITHLGDNVNTKYSDFSPHLVGEELYYSSLRFERKLTRGKVIGGGPDVAQNLVGKIMVSERRGEARFDQLANKNVNIKYENSGNSNVNTDESVLYFCKCAPNKDNKMICQIYASTKEENGEWGIAVKLPETINTPTYTTTHPAIGWDSLAQREILYFVSDRPGGKGKKDIWAADIVSEGQYSEPYNLGEVINTKGDEISPFFHQTAQTLYYSSNYTPGMGGFDIFRTQKTATGFDPPQNIGIPLNSAANDLYFIINKGDTTGFFSSNRPGSTILTGEACCNDIYGLSLPILPTEESELQEEIVAIAENPEIEEERKEQVVIKDEPVVEPELPDETPVITQQEQKTLEQLNRLLPLSLYFHNNEPRDNQTAYSSTYYKYEKMKGTYQKEHVPQYNKSIQDQISDKIEDFFVTDLTANYNKMNEFFDELIIAAENGFELEIGIQGFTSPRASVAYNKLLAGKRIASVKIDMLNYKGGVLKKYLEEGKLIIKELPLGEGKAAIGVSDDIDDPRNSIYSVEAASQRKVNFTVVEMQQD